MAKQDKHSGFPRQILDRFETVCRGVGLKMTHQRLELFRILAESHDHPSAETIHKRLIETIPTVSLDTVYRTLTTLEKHGLVKRVQTLEHQSRFEIEKDMHHHYICDQCRKIVDFDWHEFDQQRQPPLQVASLGSVSSVNIVIQGTCKSCQRRS